MSKLSVSLLFIGLSLLAVCDGSALSSESSESDEHEVGGMLGEVRKQCKRNTGSNAAFSVVMEALEKSMDCVADFDNKNFKIDYNELTNASRGTFFGKYCPKLRSLVSCQDSMLAAVQPCLKKGTFNIVQAVYNSIPEALELVCKNDGEIIMNLKDPQRRECLEQKAQQISTCFYTFAEGRSRDFDFLELTQEECSSFTNFRQCLKNPLHPCDMSDFVSILDIPMNAILPVTPCVNHTEVQNVNLPENNTIVEV
uniref:Putative secreted protein n=1 Tax=Anopheles aquasalis TaxID=42839 RepID=T1DHR6_ANOAQ